MPKLRVTITPTTAHLHLRCRMRRRCILGFVCGQAVARRVDAGQCLLEGNLVPLLGVVREECMHACASPQHIFREAMESLFRPDLYEQTRTLGVQGLEPLHELHGGCDLSR